MVILPPRTLFWSNERSFWGKDRSRPASEGYFDQKNVIGGKNDDVLIPKNVSGGERCLVSGHDAVFWDNLVSFAADLIWFWRPGCSSWQISFPQGQYGHACITLGPNEKGKGVEINNKIVGGAIPKEYIPAVIDGIEEAIKGGVYGKIRSDPF